MPDALLQDPVYQQNKNMKRNIHLVYLIWSCLRKLHTILKQAYILLPQSAQNSVNPIFT